MKKVIVFTLLLSSAASFAFAQTVPSGVTSTATTTPVVHGIKNDLGNNGKAVRQTLGRRMTIVGVVKSVGTGSLVVTNQRGDFTVNATSTTRVINRVWKPITIANIQVGDKVRVYGRVKGLDVSAAIVRDISLPATGVSTSTQR